VATYAALPDEASAHNLKDLRPHLTWAYPKVVGSELEFYQVTDSGQLEKGTFDILEPTSDCVKISINDCESVIVPGVGFDRRGHRLGQGRGFYDRALAGYQGQKIGVCFETQILNKDLPIEDHDLPMDVIVNEKYIFSPVVGKVKGI
jgi:5-formyltetrahydrofolate cyclo-ligase